MIYIYMMGSFLLFVISMLIIYMYREAHADKIVSHQLKFMELPESFGKVTIFFISDIHKRVISESIIENAIGKADIVIIGGDLTE